jgi:hypothetical protein
MSGSTNSRLAGVIALTIDGQTWSVQGEAEYSPSLVKRTTLVGQSGVDGYSEMPGVPFFSATLRISADTPIAALNAKVNSTIVAQLANGATLFGFPMWQVGDDLVVNTQEGTVPVRFEGPSLIEDMA